MRTRFLLRADDHLGAPDAKRAYNQALFTEVAPRYAVVTRALSFGRDAAWKRVLVRRLPDLAAPRCADVACGSGDIARLLAHRYPAGAVQGLDLTPAMLAIAAGAPTPANLSYGLGDMHALPLADASIDILTGGYALRNAPDLDHALTEITRVVKPGGYAAFLDFSKPAALRAQRWRLWLLSAWGGFWGWLLHGNPDVYGYIAASLRRYPDRDTLRRTLEGLGWRVLGVRRPFGGLLEILWLRKG